MSNLIVLANECKVECVDGLIVEKVRIFLDGESLVYLDSSDNAINGRKMIGGQIIGGVSIFQLIREKEMKK